MAGTQTWPKTHNLLTEIRDLVSGPNEVEILDVASQEKKKKSVIGKKWIYSERLTEWAITEGKSSNKMWQLVFIGWVIS